MSNTNKVLNVRQGVADCTGNYIVEGVVNSITPKIGDTLTASDLQGYINKPVWKVVIK